MKKEDDTFGKEFNVRINMVLQFAVGLCGGEFSAAIGLLHAALEHVTMVHKNAQMAAHCERKTQTSTEEHPSRDRDNAND